MKKIIIDARESGTTTGRYIDKLIEHLHNLSDFKSNPKTGKAAFKVTLLAKKHRLEFLRQLAPNFTVVETPYLEFSFGEQIGFKKQIEGLGADLVHFPAVQQPVWLPPSAGRVVTTMQDLTTLRFRNPAKNPLVFVAKQQVYRWVNHRAAHKSSQIITPTEFVKQDIVDFSGINPDKITVTLESADELPKPAQPVAGLEKTDFIMYIGRPTPHKNLERLIQSFTLLRKQFPDLQLVLAGKQDSNYQRIADMVAEQGIEQVVFTGFVSDQQLRWLYERCQAYIFPSLSEGFGLPGLEAMRHGAPVVSSNATCLPEVYGDAAHYFDPRDIDDMTAKISEVLIDNNLRQTLIKAGHQQAAKYSWRHMAEQTLEVYKRALT